MTLKWLYLNKNLDVRWILKFHSLVWHPSAHNERGFVSLVCLYCKEDNWFTLKLHKNFWNTSKWPFQQWKGLRPKRIQPIQSSSSPIFTRISTNNGSWFFPYDATSTTGMSSYRSLETHTSKSWGSFNVRICSECTFYAIAPTLARTTTTKRLSKIYRSLANATNGSIIGFFTCRWTFPIRVWTTTINATRRYDVPKLKLRTFHGFLAVCYSRTKEEEFQHELSPQG